MVGLVADDLGVHRADVGGYGGRRQQLHAALRTASGLIADHVGVHRAGVDHGPLGRIDVHLGDKRERLVRGRIKIGSEALAFCNPLFVVAQGVELLGKRRRRSLCANVDRRQCVGPFGCAVLECQLPRLLEERVDHDPLGGSEDHRVDELLLLVAAAVAADELHPRARKMDLEHARVRGVGQVEANDLAELRAHRQVGLAGDQHHVAEAAHRRVRRLLAAERGDLAVLDQDVVERQQQLAIRWRPVVGIGRDDEDVPVQAHLLAVVLADVRVVPVDARVGELDPVRERAADGDRRLRLVCSVVAVVEPQPVPVHRRLQIGFVGDVDDDLRALAYTQGGAWYGTVVGKHPHGRIAELLRHRTDPQLEDIAVVHLHELGIDTGGHTGGLGRELLGGRRAGHEATGAGAVGTVSGAVPVGGSLPPMSSRKGGYASVISEA